MTPPADRRPGPLPTLLRSLAAPLSVLYARIMAQRNRRFDAGRGVVRFDRPVISVGNLSVGGTGKTPMVQTIIRALLNAGHRPCIAMRGYGANPGESDEARAYSRLFPDVPIVAQPDRTHGLISLFAREHDGDAPHTDCIILDDGFQHRQIGRELDIVLIDATRDPFADRLLPAGWLREPISSLARADLVVLTHAERVTSANISAIDQSVARARGRPLDAISRHAWAGLDVREITRHDSQQQTTWLRGKRTVAACAIGNPEAFLAQAREHVGDPLAATIVLPDHDPFDRATVARIVESARQSSASAILVTDKDWSKLRDREVAWPCPVVRPRLELSFDRGGDDVLTHVLTTVRDGVPGEDPHSDPDPQTPEDAALPSAPSDERGTLRA